MSEPDKLDEAKALDIFFGKDSQKPQQPRIYVRRNGMMYRITVSNRDVWIERQTPRGSNYPCRIKPEDLFAPEWEVWNLDKLDEAIAEYEGSDED